jgi:hypothetical protein
MHKSRTLGLLALLQLATPRAVDAQVAQRAAFPPQLHVSRHESSLSRRESCYIVNIGVGATLGGAIGFLIARATRQNGFGDIIWGPFWVLLGLAGGAYTGFDRSREQCPAELGNVSHPRVDFADAATSSPIRERLGDLARSQSSGEFQCCAYCTTAFRRNASISSISRGAKVDSRTSFPSRMR